MLSFFGVVVVPEHLVEHEVQEVGISAQQLDQLLPLDLGEPFNFFGRSGLHNPQVGLEQVRLDELILWAGELVAEAGNGEPLRPRVVVLRLVGEVFLLDGGGANLEQLLAQRLPLFMDTVDEEVAEFFHLVGPRDDVVCLFLSKTTFFELELLCKL